MNLAWFAMIERQASHRGAYASVKDRHAAIRANIDDWNDRSHPFLGQAPGEILEKANSQ